ncbi:Malonyl-CoA decarboxylase (MCD) [Nesidiocoris tenuis]|uniref:Malonyl-CoA decarboxylase (MCD) n=1 Tax=Nesidiocoris tenuis TaxID=355587 RepID=A0ABN7A639_9HEMI|nr:Malonyl-CoA decarboxylase (MCD) [Nesidiocoris tenuis]
MFLRSLPRFLTTKANRRFSGQISTLKNPILKKYPLGAQGVFPSAGYYSEGRNWSESAAPSPTEGTIDCLPPLLSKRSSTMEDEQRVLTLLKDAIAFHEKNMSSWIIENKIRTLVLSYRNLLMDHKEGVIKTLATIYSIDSDKVYETLKHFKDISPGRIISPDEEKRMKDVLTPLYIWLFKYIGRLEGGVKFLVDLRRDVLTFLQRIDRKSEVYSPIQQLNSNLKDLLTLWFCVGFLNLERITWKSSCEMLQKISEYEAVHPVRNWTDLKRRVGPYRRCFVYTHSSMPSEPIVVLHTALCTEIASSTRGIVAATQKMADESSTFDEFQTIEEPNKVTTAIFYSITSTQPGLQGIELGNYLIKRVVQELQMEFPKLNQFSTLSPIPTFKKWLFEKLTTLENNKEDVPLQQLWIPVVELCGGWKNVKKQLHTNTWVQDEKLAAILEKPLMTTCAQYLYKEKRRGMALDNVANFHLKNGAVMWRLNWMADTSPRGMTNSCGLMVNYRYFLEETENNSRSYLENKVIKADEQILRLIGGMAQAKL